jgi:pimeloyl-ACP methyl ester carboxylesterase
MECTDATFISSSDGVRLAIHDFGGTASSTHSEPLVWAHATGFHAHCYQPLAARLGTSFRSYAFDHRGHGAAEGIDPTNLVWQHYGNDAIAATAHLYSLAKSPLIGVGHSMGGATLLMAAQQQPHMFRALFLYEPIVFPPQGFSDDFERKGENPLAGGARKRRAVFDSYDAALDNFSAKLPLNAFDEDVRTQYVRHGFHDIADGIALNCAPEQEARTYETGGVAPPWDELHTIDVPTWVMSGKRQPMQPSFIAAHIAEELPHATYVQWDDLGHFGPFEQPDTICSFIARTMIS